MLHYRSCQTKAFYYASQNIKCALQTKRGDGRFMNKYFVIHLKIDYSCKIKIRIWDVLLLCHKIMKRLTRSAIQHYVKSDSYKR